MSFRHTATAFIVAAAAIPAAFAESGQWINGEIGFVPAAPQSTLTREQVKKELADFVTRGGQLAAGERGYIEPAGAVVRNAARGNTQRLGSAPAPVTVDPYANGGPN
ncbi:MAG: DUF4148 domain-containing protein [Ramlibacter sp.]|nr:DUF4148 domain-containing protein [Ramlibacter sp.]